MEIVCMLVRFFGNWQPRSNGELHYVGGRIKGLTISINTRFVELIRLLYERIGIDHEKFEISISTKLLSLESDVPQVIQLEDDDDVDFFIDYCRNYRQVTRKSFPSLMVTIVERINASSDPHPVNSPEHSVNPHPVEPINPVGHINSNEQLESIVERKKVSWELETISKSHQFHSSSGSNQISQRTTPSSASHEKDDVLHVAYVSVKEQESYVPIYERQTYDDENNLFDPPSNAESFGSSFGVDAGEDLLSWMPPGVEAEVASRDARCSYANDGVQILVGEVFNNKQELRSRLAIVATIKNFEFRVSRSTKHRFEVVCQYSNCTWRVKAVSLKVDKDNKKIESEFFQVRKYEQQHSCDRIQILPNHHQASASYIGNRIKHEFMDCSRVYRPKDIIADVREHMGIDISYDKAWRAKKVALKELVGDPDESFMKLPQYCHMLESKNPGTVTALVTDSDNHFEYWFLMLNGSKVGFLSTIRPVIAIDGTFLKGKYRGTFFTASCLDANEQIFPLAFGVGDSENDASWMWFLQNLHNEIGHVEDLVIISDCHGSIIKSVREVFPNALHGFCAQHICMNLKSKYKLDDELVKLYWIIAKAYRPSEFNEHFAKLLHLNKGAAEYLQLTIGFEKWARAYFPSKRYNIMTTNIAQSMNAILSKVQGLPITSIVEFLRKTLQEWFYLRRTEAQKNDSFLSDWATNEMELRNQAARRMKAFPIDVYRFEVYDGRKNAVVDMNGQTCSCRVFELDGLPCVHALAVVHGTQDSSGFYHMQIQLFLLVIPQSGSFLRRFVPGLCSHLY